MIDNIKSVVILGASGTMGSLIGGIIAQSGIKVYFLSRTKDHAERGLQRAITQARSDMIKKNIVYGDYETLLESALQEADWIIECVSENIEIKFAIYERIEGFRKKGSIVSSTTSSLLLSQLCQGRSEDFEKNFLGIHFYNPPSRLVACEIASQSHTSPKVVQFMRDFLENKLGRIIIPVLGTTAFAGNRIACLVMSVVTKLVEEYGVEMMDYLSGPYTGRVMAPLVTIDLIGLDTYKAIIENLYKHTNDYLHDCFKLPPYMERMIENGHLGNKTPNKGGFYKVDSGKNEFVIDHNTINYEKKKIYKVEFVEKAKDMIHVGRYKDAFNIIKTAHSKEADIVRRILCLYISYSYSCVGKVTDVRYGIDGIDKAIAYGYNWAPPSLLVYMMDGKEVAIRLLQEYGIEVPDALKNVNESFDAHLNYGRFFIAC